MSRTVLLALNAPPIVVGHSAHPREHVKRIEDGKLISPKHQYLFGKDAITGAPMKGERPPCVRGVAATAAV
ncbi:MAG: hypothetical protein ABFD77_01085 [Thermotogota bacterium]